MIDIAQITQYFNIGLLVLFLLIALGLFFSGLRGFIRGVWKSTHNMVFMLSLLLIAFFTLNALTDFIGSFDISMFWKGSLYIVRNIDGADVTYYVPITSVKDTLTELIKGFYTLYNVSASASSAANFALALTGSVLKIIVFILDMFLIVTFGNFFSFLTWYLIFQHFIPRVARKLIKLRWVGMIETAVTFLVVTFLFMTPFTSLVNSLNQSYQNNRPKTDNQMVLNIGNFVDAYNDSLFAKILFNWTVDGSGMTLDTRLFDTLTTSVSGEYSIGLVGEFANLTNVIVSSASALTSTGETEVGFNPAALVTKDVVDLAFESIINSDFITNILPVITEIVTNSDILEEFIPNRLIDLSDVEWKDEIGYVRDMVDCIFDSGVIDSLFVVDENGQQTFRSFEGNDVFDFVNEIVYSENFSAILDIFKSIDQSKVLSRVVPAAIQFAMNSDTEGTLQTYLPLSWEELNEFSWGFETFIFFDFLHSTVKLDDDFLKAIFIKAGIYTPAEGEDVKPLQTLISEHAEEFKSLVVGKIEDGQLVNVDKRGQSIVYNNGERIVDDGKPRNYCLFDMNIVSRVMPSLLDNLFETDLFKDLKGNITEEDLEPFHEAVSELNSGVRLKNYKLEFDAVLDVVVTLAKDEELLDSLMTKGSFDGLMEEEGNIFSIGQEHINCFKQAISKMDKSSILYSVLAPTLKSIISGDDIANTLNDLGLRADVLASAISHDMKRSKENRSLFTEFSSLLDRWGDLNVVYSLTTDSGDTDGMMEKLKDQDTIDAFVRILKTLHNNEIINPKPEPGDDYEENENMYGLLEYVFSMTESMGLTVTRDTMRAVEQPGHTWDDEFDAIGGILQFIAEKDIMNAADEFSDGLSRSALMKLKESGEGNYDVPGLFAKVDDSYIFSESLGPFLDQMFGDSLSGFLIDSDNHVSFENITNWTVEGQNIKNLMDSLYTIVPEDDDEAKDFLSNFNMSTLDKIVDLNDMLHNLAHSGIFTYIDTNGVSHFQFGEWLYGKVDSSMVKFSVDANEYDLLADPSLDDSAYTPAETWDKWGTRPEDNLETADEYFLEWKDKYNADGTKESTHYIAYKDFVYVRGMANDDPNLPSFWCDYGTFQEKQAAFLEAHESKLTDLAGYLDNEWGAYFASDDFIADYDEVFAVDEISRVTRFMTYSLRIIEARTDSTKMPFDSMKASFLDGLLNSINETSCLRICSYNFYRIAADNVFNNYSGFSLSSAYNAYMVDVGVGMYDFDAAHDLRGAELDKLVTLYSFVKDAQASEVFDDSGNLKYEKMNDNAFIAKMKNALQQMNDSYVFHRNGSSKTDQLTVFQGLFNTMLGESEIKNIIYLGDNSPKDHYNKTNGLYTDATSKIRYLVTNTFLTDKEIDDYVTAHSGSNFDALRDKQQDEVDSLLESIKKIYSLKDSGGNQVTKIDDADMKSSENRTTINQLLGILNTSDLLCDLVPNTIYNLFIQNDKFSISSGSDSVDFTRVDPFYHYYYNESLVKRSEVDFNARYLNSDINGIYYLLGDYQEYNDLAGSGNLNNCSTLMALAGTETAGVFDSNGVLPRLLKHLHGCNLFHSPARGHAYSIYYTNKFEGDGFTLFEEMMSKVCSFVGLDDLSFDADYDPAHNAEYTSASAKMTKLISAITLADDTGSSTTYYHNAQGEAWEDEIDTIMHLAYTAASVSTDEELNTSTLELDKMSPETIKKMLRIVNNSDLVSDCVPNLVKKGFEAIHLGTQTTYSDVDYAYYHIGQEAFGGVLGDAPAGTEIDNIYNIMESLAKYDIDDNFTGYATSMNNMNDFIKGEGAAGEARGLNGLMKYLYDSHIFNTSLTGVYNAYNVVDGRSITAQGVLLYNSLGSDLTAYVAKDADSSTSAPTALDRIQAFSRIMHMKQYGNDTYLVEAKGIQRLVNLVDGHMDSSTFSSGDIQAVKDNKALILSIIETSYNVGAPYENHRSALASEFISGVLNTILENEYNKLDNPSNYPDYQYVKFSFGQDEDDGVLTIEDYASLNEVEYNGLDGMIDSLDYLTGANVAIVAANIKVNAQHLEDNFAKMGQTPTTNSNIARAIYLTEAHKTFKDLGNSIIVDSSFNHFVPVNETTKDPSYPEPYNIYSNGFSFKWYGQHIRAFIEDVTLS